MFRSLTRTILRAAAGLALAAALFLLFFGFGMGVGCGSPDVSPPVGPWSATLSTSGGFSGGGGSNTVLSDGFAFSGRWPVAGTPVVETPLGTVPPDELSALLTALLAGDLHATDRGSPANMTTTLVFATDDERHVWHHEFQSEPAPPVERAILAFEAAVRASR